MELWGGHECTVNRVADRYCDQSRLTGHDDRIEDLHLFADLGVTRLRYPVLWERAGPERPGDYDFGWSDARLAELRRLGIAPIVGLLHHGSGPHFTSLVDPHMPRLFADYAAAVAERYPWVEDWTPVNEPLTTARFAGLYGHWYPHGQDESAFLTALVTQVEATIAAMRAIRKVNPAARLVQTDDLGDTYATAELVHVADHYNHRRWLGFDLLTGRIDESHYLWPALEKSGLADRVRAIVADPCPPDVIGVNHYITSDRFLDHRLDRYPDLVKPAVGFHDFTAARVMDPPPPGLESVLRQAWQRYGIPLAVTESHLGCTREEQMRWLVESWTTCERLAADGVDIRAMTAWALLGNYDWCSLLTVPANHYEGGAFDVRAGAPRPTALTRVLKAFGGDADAQAWLHGHPALGRRGWWRRDVRLEHAPYVWTERQPEMDERAGPPILITGASGTLGQALARACTLRGLDYVLTDRGACAIDDPRSVAAALDLHQPWAVINAAGWVRVDEAEGARDACFRANADGAALMAEACAERGLRYTVFSSDLVFDGAKNDAYVEDDAPRPLNVYGASKAAAEERVLAALPEALVVRTAAFFSPFDAYNFAVWVERELRHGRPVQAAEGFVVTPTFVPDLVHASLDLLIDEEKGIWHLTNQEPVSWFDFGRRVADTLDLDAKLVRPARPSELGWRARRPAFVPLGSRHGQLLPKLEDALARHRARRGAEAA
ncbi:family 1 glycosylhydrolase [Sphingomonas sp.]|uniref:family 1 glycosylhydrolase n=1 Tax=Sphingomonas sp. TaxID=28214 RepID=UPI002DBC584F|nr:family 1 glycosylhydrolase [Sphingomonas sp.]HEU4968854.1 family 1 glycosylhydrolase [Sphingomonas sp.]